MNKTYFPLAALAAAALLASCASGTDEAARHITLVNTASILFPIPARNSEELENYKTLFWMQLTEFSPHTTMVQSISEVRTGPGETYEIVNILVPGEQVTYNGQVGPWLRLTNNGGYVSTLNIYNQPWRVTMVGTGEEELVNECLGGLVNFRRITEDIGRPFYVIRSYCGGEPVLHMSLGDQMSIDHVTYQMVAVTVLSITGNAALVVDLPGDVLVYTDDIVNGESVVLSLERIQK
ncbi:MAG: SH3 domain-containing protein [Promicromonosporaceae bacterium]|nr:SH3 domain-containing protein [Promicromonosporaceae bacterium]